jgi:hypothetical protein
MREAADEVHPSRWAKALLANYLAVTPGTCSP